MPRYMLDADTVTYALRGQGQVAARLLEHQPSDLCISAITLAGLNFGAEAKRSQKIRRSEPRPHARHAARQLAAVGPEARRRPRRTLSD